jgi:hypothetical protein
MPSTMTYEQQLAVAHRVVEDERRSWTYKGTSEWQRPEPRASFGRGTVDDHQIGKHVLKDALDALRDSVTRRSNPFDLLAD